MCYHRGHLSPTASWETNDLQGEILSFYAIAMARLSKVQEQARNQILQLESLNLLPETAAVRILAALQLAIPADEVALFGVDPSSLLFNRILASIGGLEVWMKWLHLVYLAQEPFYGLTFPGLMQSNLTAVAIHDFLDTCLGIPTQTLDKAIAVLAPKDWHHIYHDIETPASGILRVCFAAKGRWIAALELGRKDSKRCYRPSDVGFMQLLTPPIGRVLQAAFERERAMQSASLATDASGILVLGSKLQEQFCNPAAELWMKQLRDDDVQREGKLPTAVWAAIARLNAKLETQEPLYVWTAAGNLRIEASRSDRDDSIAIVFAPERPLIPVELPIHWQLTHQERQVVLLLVRGLSNAQIAATLIVSENTIESHLSHIYQKLYVHNRRELLASLFHEVYQPQIC
ncbi:MAG: response regulator transcription factor [Microcoleus sp.]